MENKIKVKCLHYSVTSADGAMTHNEIIPVCWIEKQFGSVDAFIQDKKEFYGHRLNETIIKKSNDYDDTYLSDILESHNVIDSIIEYVEGINGEINKKQLLKYISSLV